MENTQEKPRNLTSNPQGSDRSEDKGATESSAPSTVQGGAEQSGGKSETKQLIEAVGSLTNMVQDIDHRLKDVETGGRDRFMKDASEEDIQRAAEHRQKVQDPKLIEIVDNTLGTDFGIDIEPNKDRPGFLFTIIVPERLSLLPMRQRPKKSEGGGYEKAGDGSTVMEDYKPEDRRSIMVSTLDSYDSITKHCEKVRAKIVSDYQKMQKPLPAFDIK